LEKEKLSEIGALVINSKNGIISITKNIYGQQLIKQDKNASV
jgi:hypothetical protein